MLVKTTNEVKVMRGDYRQYVGKSDMVRPVAHLFVKKSEALCSRKLDDDMRELESVSSDEICRQCLVVAVRKNLIESDIGPASVRKHICGDPNDPCDYDCMIRAARGNAAEDAAEPDWRLYRTGTGTVVDLRAIEGVGVPRSYTKNHCNDDHFAFDILMRSGQRLPVEIQTHNRLDIEREREKLIQAWAVNVRKENSK